MAQEALGRGLNRQSKDIYKAIYSKPAFVPQYSGGGLIEGPGTGTSDSIDKPIPKGGFIIPAKVVSILGADFLQKYNDAAASEELPDDDEMPQATASEELPDNDEMLQAKVSDGEFEISPEAVAMFGAEHFEEIVELVMGQGTDPKESSEGEVMAAGGYNPDDPAKPTFENVQGLKDRAANAAANASNQAASLRANNPNISPSVPQPSAGENVQSLLKDRAANAAANASNQSATLRANNPNISPSVPQPQPSTLNALRQRLSSGVELTQQPGTPTAVQQSSKETPNFYDPGIVGLPDVKAGVQSIASGVQSGVQSIRQLKANADATSAGGQRPPITNAEVRPISSYFEGLSSSPVANKITQAFGDKQPTSQERQTDIKNAVAEPQPPKKPPEYTQQRFGDTVRTQLTQAGYDADPNKDRLPQTGELPLTPEQRAEVERGRAFENFSRYLEKVAAVQEDANRTNALRQQDFLQRFGVPIDNETRVDAGSVAQIQGNEARSRDQSSVNDVELVKARLADRLGRDQLAQPKFNARVTNNGDVVQYQESGAGAPERADAAAKQAQAQAEQQLASTLYDYYKENPKEQASSEHFKILQKYFPNWARLKN